MRELTTHSDAELLSVPKLDDHRLARHLLWIPPGKRAELLQSVVSFRPYDDVDRELAIGSIRAAFADAWEQRFGDVVPNVALRKALEPPVPIDLVLPLLAFKDCHTEVEMRNAVDTLLDELNGHVRRQYGSQQLPLFEDEARGEVLDEPCAVGGGKVLALEELVAAGTKFPTVYADPPWQYTNRASRAAAENHYRTLSVDEICREPVRELAMENAHLHLWTTNAFLRDAFTVIDAWGFTFKSCLIWVKDELGMGNYWRVSHEFLCDRSHKNSYVVLLSMWCCHGSPPFLGRF